MNILMLNSCWVETAGEVCYEPQTSTYSYKSKLEL